MQNLEITEEEQEVDELSGHTSVLCQMGSELPQEFMHATNWGNSKKR